MRFISHIRHFSLQILPPVTEVLPGGLMREVVPLYVAQFQQTNISLEELEFAERVFQQIPGRTQTRDEVTLTPIRNRLSIYDSEAPSEQQEFDSIDLALDGQRHPLLERGDSWGLGTMKRLTEQKLIARQGENYLLYTPEPTVAPWPAYNQFPGSPEDLVAVLEAQAHYLPGVLAYERENLNRPEIVALLEERIAALAEEPAEEFVT